MLHKKKNLRMIREKMLKIINRLNDYIELVFLEENKNREAILKIII